MNNSKKPKSFQKISGECSGFMKKRPGKPVKKYNKKKSQKPKDRLEKTLLKYKFVDSDGHEWDYEADAENLIRVVDYYFGDW